MSLRRDAVTGFSAFVAALEQRYTAAATPRSVWTIGQVEVHPNAPSIVPGRVSCSVQMRDGALNQLDLMCDITRDTAQEIAKARNLKISSIQNKSVEPVDMDERMIIALCEAANLNAPGRWRRMPSGALHDAMNLANRMPTGMLFVPSIGGVSHAFEEDTRRDDLVAGVQVMADTVVQLT